MRYLGSVETLVALGFENEDYGTIQHYNFRVKSSLMSVVFPSTDVFILCDDIDDFVNEEVLEMYRLLKNKDFIVNELPKKRAKRYDKI